MKLVRWIRSIGPWMLESLITILAMLAAGLLALRPYSPFKRRLDVRTVDTVRPVAIGALVVALVPVVVLSLVGALASPLVPFVLIAAGFATIYGVLDRQFEAIEEAFAEAEPYERYQELGPLLWITVYREFRMLDVALHNPEMAKHDQPITVKMDVIIR